MSFAARRGDTYICSITYHPGGPVLTGARTVLVGGSPAARVSDHVPCTPPTFISMGAPSVLIEDAAAARVGDPTYHGGVIVTGEPTVLIGMSDQANVLAMAAERGAPLCEVCGD